VPRERPISEERGDEKKEDRREERCVSRGNMREETREMCVRLIESDGHVPRTLVARPVVCRGRRVSAQGDAAACAIYNNSWNRYFWQFNKTVARAREKRHGEGPDRREGRSARHLEASGKVRSLGGRNTCGHGAARQHL
jgi:hypothetical protein